VRALVSTSALVICHRIDWVGRLPRDLLAEQIHPPRPFRLQRLPPSASNSHVPVNRWRNDLLGDATIVRWLLGWSHVHFLSSTREARRAARQLCCGQAGDNTDHHRATAPRSQELTNYPGCAPSSISCFTKHEHDVCHWRWCTWWWARLQYGARNSPIHLFTPLYLGTSHPEPLEAWIAATRHHKCQPSSTAARFFPLASPHTHMRRAPGSTLRPPVAYRATLPRREKRELFRFCFLAQLFASQPPRRSPTAAPTALTSSLALHADLLDTQALSPQCRPLNGS